MTNQTESFYCGALSSLMKASLLIILPLLCSTCLVEGANRYVEVGFPSPTREWRGADYQRAIEAVTSGGANLPTRHGADGDEMFDRIVNTANFNFARNRTLPIDMRLSEMATLLQCAGKFSIQYVSKANQGVDLHRECAELGVFGLNAVVVTLELIDEFVPTIPKDEKYEVRMEDLKSAKSGVETIFSGLETSLEEGKFYSSADLSLILRSMKESLPRLKEALSDDFRIELRKRLQKRLSEFRSDSDAELINAMIGELAQPTPSG